MVVLQMWLVQKRIREEWEERERREEEEEEERKKREAEKKSRQVNAAVMITAG